VVMMARTMMRRWQSTVQETCAHQRHPHRSEARLPHSSQRLRRSCRGAATNDVHRHCPGATINDMRRHCRGATTLDVQ
jgi:hypothetical protein